MRLLSDCSIPEFHKGPSCVDIIAIENSNTLKQGKHPTLTLFL